jgi:hypothetical protein
MCGGVEMAEKDSAAVEGAGGALLGIGTATDWTKEDVGVHSVVLGDAGKEVAGHFDSRNHVVTNLSGQLAMLASMMDSNVSVLGP